MKQLILQLCLVLCALPFKALAEGPRGAAERILYYYAYLAEEIAVPNEDDRIIGAGCPGSLPGNRCTFNEFLEFIWKAKKDGNFFRPTVNVLGAGEVFEDINVGSLYNRIVKWRDASFNPITGATDSQRIFLGSEDYYDALRRVAGPIGALANMGLTDDRARKIVTNGKLSAQLLTDLRLQDLDKYRLNALASILDVEPDDIKTKPGRNTVGVPGNWKTFDPIATLQNLRNKKIPNAMSTLGTALFNYRTGGTAAKGHWAALASADAAQRLCGCQRS